MGAEIGQFNIDIPQVRGEGYAPLGLRLAKGYKGEDTLQREPQINYAYEQEAFSLYDLLRHNPSAKLAVLTRDDLEHITLGGGNLLDTLQTQIDPDLDELIIVRVSDRQKLKYAGVERSPVHIGYRLSTDPRIGGFSYVDNVIGEAFDRGDDELRGMITETVYAPEHMETAALFGFDLRVCADAEVAAHYNQLQLELTADEVYSLQNAKYQYAARSRNEYGYDWMHQDAGATALLQRGYSEQAIDTLAMDPAEVYNSSLAYLFSNEYPGHGEANSYRGYKAKLTQARNLADAFTACTPDSVPVFNGDNNLVRAVFDRGSERNAHPVLRRSMQELQSIFGEVDPRSAEQNQVLHQLMTSRLEVYEQAMNNLVFTVLDRPAWAIRKFIPGAERALESNLTKLLGFVETVLEHKLAIEADMMSATGNWDAEFTLVHDMAVNALYQLYERDYEGINANQIHTGAVSRSIVGASGGIVSPQLARRLYTAAKSLYDMASEKLEPELGRFEEEMSMVRRVKIGSLAPNLLGTKIQQQIERDLEDGRTTPAIELDTPFWLFTYSREFPLDPLNKALASVADAGKETVLLHSTRFVDHADRMEQWQQYEKDWGAYMAVTEERWIAEMALAPETVLNVHHQDQNTRIKDVRGGALPVHIFQTLRRAEQIDYLTEDTVVAWFDNLIGDYENQAVLRFMTSGHDPDVYLPGAELSGRSIYDSLVQAGYTNRNLIYLLCGWDGVRSAVLPTLAVNTMSLDLDHGIAQRDQLVREFHDAFAQDPGLLDLIEYSLPYELQPVDGSRMVDLITTPEFTGHMVDLLARYWDTEPRLKNIFIKVFRGNGGFKEHGVPFLDNPWAGFRIGRYMQDVRAATMTMYNEATQQAYVFSPTSETDTFYLWRSAHIDDAQAIRAEGFDNLRGALTESQIHQLNQDFACFDRTARLEYNRGQQVGWYNNSPLAQELLAAGYDLDSIEDIAKADITFTVNDAMARGLSGTQIDSIIANMNSAEAYEALEEGIITQRELEELHYNPNGYRASEIAHLIAENKTKLFSEDTFSDDVIRAMYVKMMRCNMHPAFFENKVRTTIQSARSIQTEFDPTLGTNGDFTDRYYAEMENFAQNIIGFLFLFQRAGILPHFDPGRVAEWEGPVLELFTRMEFHFVETLWPVFNAYEEDVTIEGETYRRQLLEPQKRVSNNPPVEVYSVPPESMLVFVQRRLQTMMDILNTNRY
ncbi:hypothetical protein KC909_00025 [Candidatus Dojkabacteria bacterium]|uniref:Uncharacterized protein n=1 Tax=Candidatus Dojkabacteria bacterium TaxID=2099670 RepID=A0A955L4H4_9BACT|nr:hypothetical protein [Candidatus Dojkabacteria bacterium]